MARTTPLAPYQATIAPDVILDGRLALFHCAQRWLAVADLHFGYELSQRAAGRLMPLWGMASVEERLKELLIDYRPQRLIIVGDVVHDRASAAEARALLKRLSIVTEPIVLSGNHDRFLRGTIELRDFWKSERYYFHHGHCAVDIPGAIQIIGHHHPAGIIADGAGLRMKLPAFVQQGDSWILPAFSPWAAGAAWETDVESRMWLCTPKRILRIPPLDSAVA